MDTEVKKSAEEMTVAELRAYIRARVDEEIAKIEAAEAAHRAHLNGA